MWDNLLTFRVLFLTAKRRRCITIRHEIHPTSSRWFTSFLDSQRKCQFNISSEYVWTRSRFLSFLSFFVCKLCINENFCGPFDRDSHMWPRLYSKKCIRHALQPPDHHDAIDTSAKKIFGYRSSNEMRPLRQRPGHETHRHTCTIHWHNTINLHRDHRRRMTYKWMYKEYPFYSKYMLRKCVWNILNLERTRQNYS